jgi:transcriptional regulator of acetoin/glycerol metabolism
MEALLVRQAIDWHRGNVSRAARTLGLSRAALYRRLDRHRLPPPATLRAHRKSRQP